MKKFTSTCPGCCTGLAVDPLWGLEGSKIPRVFLMLPALLWHVVFQALRVGPDIQPKAGNYMSFRCSRAYRREGMKEFKGNIYFLVNSNRVGLKTFVQSYSVP